MNVLYVFLGGGVGCVVRYFFGLWFIRMQFFSFPWATFVANVSSCVIFAGAIFLLGEKGAFSSSSIVRPLLLTGFCGGLSTFSSFSFETFELAKRGEFMIAGANMLVNVIFCFAVFFWMAKK